MGSYKGRTSYEVAKEGREARKKSGGGENHKTIRESKSTFCGKRQGRRKTLPNKLKVGNVSVWVL